MWAAEAEGAKFWMQVVTGLKNRGGSDIFIACVDGLKGFPEASEAVFELMYLALRNISKRRTMPIKNWGGALNRFAILFEGRVPMGGLSSNSLTRNPV